MTLLIWSVKGPYNSVTPAISKSAEIGQTFPFPLRAGRIEFHWSLTFPCCEYRCQLPAEGLTGAMSSTACLNRALAGWSELRGAGVGSMGDAWKVVELFTFQLCIKLFWCFVWLTLMFSCFLCLSPSLSCINPCSPTSLLSWIVCLLLKILLVLGGLWKIYNRWAVFEGYVFSNYLFAEGFGWVAAGPNVLPVQSLLPACMLFVACESNRIQIINQLNNPLQTWSGTWS